MGATTFTASADCYSPIDSNAGWMVRGTITMSSSYATGGDTLTAAQMGLGTIKNVIVNGGVVLATPTGEYTLRYNQANGTIQAFGGAASSGAIDAEVTNATNLATIVGDIIAYG